MDAPQGSADLAILPEDVASSLSCGNLALWGLCAHLFR
ncbi:hypothetical protein TIFTF001_043812 [Ficus carica]|uniref:Uncharacterized protein n=1 Tax=Ficus carica TaxID=3494 RepID=A0AA88CPP2_FICCA|nr:hypothetical protein TIFTF001_043812 [Ficus carica]